MKIRDKYLNDKKRLFDGQAIKIERLEILENLKNTAKAWHKYT